MSTARDEVLARIRGALGDVPADESVESVPTPRRYRSSGNEPADAVLNMFAERLAEYRAIVRRVPLIQVRAEIEAACKHQGVRSLVVPPDVHAAWLPEGVKILCDTLAGPLSNDQLDAADGVLTGCALAIAQTGTIVLDGGRAQGRRVLCLLPDYHLCIVYRTQVVELVPEAISTLGDTVRQTRRPVTFISGPSATSDIELHRVEGVHGPRTLEVLLVDGEPEPHPCSNKPRSPARRHWQDDRTL